MKVGVGMKDKKYIRFITPNYYELFRIPDGGHITIQFSNGETINRKCEYLDRYHFRCAGHTYHICEFAEMLQRNGHKVRPANPNRTISVLDMER